MGYEEELALFYVVTVILLIGFFLLFFYSPIKSFYHSKFTMQSYYKTVRKTALDNDFYLINKFELTLDEGTAGVHIDHILFGDKFIYVIKDRYYKGALAAKEEDKSWVAFPTRKKKQYVDNPMIKNVIRCDRLALASGLDRSFFVSVVLINDNLFVTPIKTKSDSSVIVSLSKFEKYIEANERRSDVSRFREKDLAIAVRDLAELNQRGKKNQNGL